MDVTRWKTILFEWVKKTQLVEVTGTLEHIDIQQFFEAFHPKTEAETKQTLSDFLNEHFPSFEVLYDEDHNISSQDSMYIFSLFLYYSCVTKSTSYFQKCCQSLSGKQQPALYKFFADLKQAFESKKPITKEVLRVAIKESVLSPIATQNFISSSPIRTPDKNIQTPSRNIYLQRSKELQKTKTMLENERYERTMIESELRESEKNVQNLVKELKSVKQENTRLKTELILDRGQENLSPNKAIRDEQIRSRMQKEIDAREETIVTLRYEIDALTAQNGKSTNKIAVMDKELTALRHKMNELDAVIEELNNDGSLKSSRIQALEETNNELLSFIDETRKTNSTPRKDMSSEYYDATFSTITTVSNSSDSGENLAKCVIDVQLKEQEMENHRLQELLEAVNSEKETLDQALLAHGETITALQKLTKEQLLCIDELREEIKNMTAQIDSSKMENGDLQSLVAASNAEVKAAEEKRKELEAKLDEVKAQMEVAANEHSEFENKQNLAVSEMKTTIESLETTLAARDATLQETLAQIDSLKAQERELEAKNVAAEKERVAENEKLVAQIETAKKENDELRASVVVSQANVEQVQSKYESHLAKFTKEMQAAKESREEVDELLKDTKATLAGLLEKLENEKLVHSKLVKDLQAEIDSKTTEMKSMADNIDALKAAHKVEVETIREKQRQDLKVLMAAKDVELTKVQVNLQNKLKESESTRKLMEESIQSKTQHFESRIEELEKEIAVQLKQHESLERTVNKIEQEKSNLIRTAATEKEELKDDIQELTAQLEKAKKENVDLQSSVDASSGEVKAAEEQRKKLEAKLEEVKVQLEVAASQQSELEDKHKAAVSELKTSIESLDSDLRAKASAVDDMEIQIEKLKTRESELETKISAVEEEKIAQIEDLVVKHDAAKLENKELKNLVKAAQGKVEEVEAAEKKRKELEAKLEEMKVQVEVAASQRLELESKQMVAIFEMKATVSSLEATITERDALVSETVAKLGSVEKERNELQLLLVAAQEKVEVEAKVAEEKHKELESKLKEVEVQLKAKETQRLELEDKHKTVLVEMKSTIETLEVEIAAKTTSVADMSTQIDSLKAREQELEAKIAAADGKSVDEIQSLAAQLDNAKTENAELQSLLVKTQANVEREVKVAEAKLLELETKLEAVKVELDVTASQREELESKHASAVSEMKTVISSLETALAEKEAVVSKTVAKLEVAEKKSVELQSLVVAAQAKAEEKGKAAEEERKLFEEQRKELEAKLEEVKTQAKASEMQRLELEEKQKLAVSEMKTSIESLESDLEAKAAAAVDLETEIKKLKTRESELEAKISAAEKERIDEFEDLVAKHDARKLEIIELKVSLEAAQGKVEQKVKAAEEQRKMLESKLEEMKLEMEVAESQRSLVENKHRIAVLEMKSTIESLEATVTARDSAILDMVSQIENLKSDNHKQAKSDNEHSKELLKKLERYADLEEDMQKLETEHLREKAFNDKMSSDFKVINAKLMKEREEKASLTKILDDSKKKHHAELLEMKRKADLEVKETRLELEGKLEKMKEKMKSLYNEEIAKKKQSYETTLKDFRDENLQVKERCGQLEGQLLTVQKDREQLQGENVYLQSKLRFLEKNGSSQISGSIGMSRPSTTSQMNVAHFGMEDEAGELFNNTFLSELKTGSLTSIDKNNDYNAAELQRRNSAYPAAMRSSYAVVNTDVNLGEQEMRDGFMLDDSQTALLHNGNRKKQSTSYKRPGPPTPSKNAGRLSIGASEINYNNILKDTKNSENVSKNTPSRLKAFFMGKGNSENVKPSPRRLSIFGKK